MPYTDLQDFPEPEQHLPWDQIQSSLSPEAGLDDVGLVKEADNAGKEMIQLTQDTLYSNTQLLNETLEIDRHMRQMTEEDMYPYSVIEKSLVQMGYQRPNIRRSFHRVTGIDPVRAYLDVANYPIPPGAVPRYNYGWGEAKEGSADYLYIMPWVDKYALFKLTGLQTERIAEHYMLDDARRDLSGRVRKLLDVTPDVSDTLSDIFQKVAAVGKLGPKGADLYKKVTALCENDPDTASRMLAMAHDEGQITDSEFRTIAESVILAAPSVEPTLTAPERIDEREFQSFRENQEGRSFKEMKQNTIMPGQEFASSWEDRHKVDFWGVLTESREMFSQLVSGIQGYRIEAAWGTFRIMPQPNLAVSDDNHILDGSVAVGATVETADGQKESEIAILMFIHNGKLRYAGKFKGVNEREYAFTTMGLEEYFEDLEGTTALDEQVGLGAGTPMGLPSDQPGRL